MQTSQRSSNRTALLVIDVQESFRHRPYWHDDELADYLAQQNALIAGCKARGIPIVQIFHVEPEGAFSLESGYVKALEGVRLDADYQMHKNVHSALVGTPLQHWLLQRSIGNLIVSGIRTEQCCETTTRHASDLGYHVDYVTEATLSFAMYDRRGERVTPAQIRRHTEMVLADRFADIHSVDSVLKKFST